MFKILEVEGIEISHAEITSTQPTHALDVSTLKDMPTLESIHQYIEKCENYSNRNKDIEDCVTIDELLYSADYGFCNEYIQQNIKVLETASSNLPFNIFKELCYSLRLNFDIEALIVVRGDFSYFTNPADLSNEQLQNLCYLSRDLQVFDNISSVGDSDDSCEYSLTGYELKWFDPDRTQGSDRFTNFYDNGIKVINMNPGGSAKHRDVITNGIIWSWIRFITGLHPGLPIGTLTAAVTSRDVNNRVGGKSLNSKGIRSLSREWANLIDCKSQSGKADISIQIYKYMTSYPPFYVKLRTAIRTRKLDLHIKNGIAGMAKPYAYKNTLTIKVG